MISSAFKFMLPENSRPAHDCLNYDDLKFGLRVLEAFARSCEIKVSGGRWASCKKKEIC